MANLVNPLTLQGIIDSAMLQEILLLIMKKICDFGS